MSRDAGAEFVRLAEVMRRLRAEGGCPWDRAQDIRSVRPYLIEEAYEVLDEMDRAGAGGSWKPLCEELGDLLFQIVFHSQLAAELGEFTLADVCATVADKLVRRHPHVFGEGKVEGAEQVLQNWAKLKAAERRQKHGHEGSVLDGVPSGAPALQRAERLTEKASRVGFDWPDVKGAREKLDEELRELDEAISHGGRDELEHELGDVLFSLANVARFINTPPEDALRQANARFTRRFQTIEAGLREQGIPFGEASLEQMEALWQQAKRTEKEHLLPPPALAPRARVGAVRLPCADPRAAKAFWIRAAGALGWRLQPHLSAELHCDTGGVDLVFVPSQEPPGPVHLLIELPSRAAVDAARGRLMEEGANTTSPAPDAEGLYGFEFQGPDRNVFRIYARA